jgi:hypothetical protein
LLIDPAQPASAAVSSTWSATGSMTVVRSYYTATLLLSGKVLVAGGIGGGPSGLSASAEIYDPAAGTWSATGSMTAPRSAHTATLLPSGKVLVVGGLGSAVFPPVPVASAELYDPVAGTWSATGSMTAARTFHTATLLTSGKVLVAGGDSTGFQGSVMASAELYDPAAGAWSATGSMATVREVATALLLPSGKVLVAGGSDNLGLPLALAELYDPVAGTWGATGSMANVRAAHTATILSSGNVLVAGGEGSASVPVASAELYDPNAGTWSATGSMTAARLFHTATILPSGNVLAAGGTSVGVLGTGADVPVASAELYNPVVGTWSATGSMTAARELHTATLLRSGVVLVAGGGGSARLPLASAELYLLGPLALSVTGPASLAVSGSDYSPNPFTVSAVIQNNGAAPAHGVTLTLAIPQGLTLVAGQSATQSFGDLAVGAMANATWSVVAAPQTSTTTLTYSVTASATNTQSNVVNRDVIVPDLLAGAHRPVIYVPGFGGSELYGVNGGSVTVKNSVGIPIIVSYKPGEVIWLNGPQLLSVDPSCLDCNGEYFNLLQFNAQGLPVVTDIQPNGQLVTSPSGFPLLSGGYAGVQAAFEGHGYKLAKDLFFFTYDFRFGAETFAGRLDQLVAQAMALNHSDGVDIVAHSFGNLVTRSWLLTGTHRSSLKHYVALGAPELGTPKGTFAALGGLCLTDFPCELPAPVIKNLVETFPAGADVGVSKSYYTVYRGQDKQHPLPYVDYRSNPAGDFTNYAGLRQTLTSSGVTEAALASAEAFRASDLSWPAAIPAGAKVSLMSGTGHCTIGQISAHDHQFPPFFGPHTTTFDYAEVNGDATVVEESSSLNNGQIGNLPVYYRVADHDQMARQPAILDDAIALLQDQAISHGSRQAPKCRIVALHSPMEMLLTDPSGLRLGGLDAHTSHQEVPSAQFGRFADMKLATLETASRFRVDVKGTGIGDSTLDIRSIGLNGVVDAIIFRHLTTTPATTGSFTYDSGTGVASNLTLDVNGNGKNIQTIAPILLSGSAVDDTTPPTITITSPAVGQALVGEAPIGWTASDAGSGVSLSMAVIDANATSGQNQGENSDNRHRIVLNQPGSVTLAPGSHILDVYAEDKAGNSATAHRDFTVDAFKWRHAGGGEDDNASGAGSAIHVQFVVTNPDGRFVADPTVVVDLLDAHGSVVATGSVEIQDHEYRATIQTRGLAPGSYLVRARFNSSLLVGTEFAPGVTPIPTPSPSPTASPTPSPSSAPAASPSAPSQLANAGGAPPRLPGAPLLLGLLGILGVLLAALGRLRARST